MARSLTSVVDALTPHAHARSPLIPEDPEISAQQNLVSTGDSEDLTQDLCVADL